MRTESKNVQKTQSYNTVPADSVRHSKKSNSITVPVGQNNSKTSSADSFNKTTNANLTPQEQQRYESIYKRIDNICKEQDIDIKLAMDFGLLEKIPKIIIGIINKIA